jgi:hypothetical protein
LIELEAEKALVVTRTEVSGKTSEEPSADNSVTKPSSTPALLGWMTPGVVGKSVSLVSPSIYACPAESIAIAEAAA